MEEASSSSAWTKGQEKAFENALATHPEDCSDRWEKIAAHVPGKTIDDVKLHYELLVEDVNGIESGRVPLPRYASSSEGEDSINGGGSGKKAGHGHGDSGKNPRPDQERRKGVAWSEEEHRLFLLGLDKYGKGDWRSISRNFVISRTPTQVASHAQKYFIRLNSMNKDRRRTSIHDVTTVTAADPSAPQVPITGQINALAAAAAREKTGKHPVGVSIFGTPIGQPVVGAPFPAAGTLVNLPVPAAPHVGYAVRTPVSIPSSTYRMMPPSSSGS